MFEWDKYASNTNWTNITNDKGKTAVYRRVGDSVEFSIISKEPVPYDWYCDFVLQRGMAIDIDKMHPYGLAKVSMTIKIYEIDCEEELELTIFQRWYRMWKHLPLTRKFRAEVTYTNGQEPYAELNPVLRNYMVRVRFPIRELR